MVAPHPQPCVILPAPLFQFRIPSNPNGLFPHPLLGPCWHITSSVKPSVTTTTCFIYFSVAQLSPLEYLPPWGQGSVFCSPRSSALRTCPGSSRVLTKYDIGSNDIWILHFLKTFLVALGLRHSTQAFSSCGKQWLLFKQCTGFSPWWFLLLQGTGHRMQGLQELCSRL